MQQFPTPKNPKNIKQFLGLTGYYRRFIKNYSKIAKPLTDLFKKDKPFKWTEKQQKAFETLKDTLCKSPILQFPDFSKPFILTTDASGYAIGGILSQGELGKDLPIAYTSRILNPHEEKYSTIEKECLAVVYCVNHFRPYLYGRKFKIVTDHKPLVWLHNIKDPTSRLWKWQLKLSEYEYEIVYKQGKINLNADALSRNPPETTTVMPIHTSSSDDDILFDPPNIPIPLEESPITPKRKRDASPTSEEQIEKESKRHKKTEMEPNPIAIQSPFTSPIPTQGPSTSRKVSFSLDDTEDFIQMNDDKDDYSQTSTEESEHEEQLFDPDPQFEFLTIRRTKEPLLLQKDNLIVFLTYQGTPACNGAKELHLTEQLPNPSEITPDRPHVKTIERRHIISIPIQERPTAPITSTQALAGLRMIQSVLDELNLSSFSIRETNPFGDISWHFIEKKLAEIFKDYRITITYCSGSIQVPPTDERPAIIADVHNSVVNGHKGVTKTLHRIREKYI